MAIFIGDTKNWNAVRAAYAINWAVQNVIRPAIKKSWSDGADFCEIGHRTGIDTGEALIVRGGARDNNDLISVGGAPNIAAKLGDLKNGYSTYITKRVYDELTEDLLFYTENDVDKPSWTKLYGPVDVGGHPQQVYGSYTYWGV